MKHKRRNNWTALSRSMKRKVLIKGLVKNHGFLAKTAKYIGITYQTIYNWVKQDALVRQALEAVGEWKLDESEDKLMEAIKRGEAWAVCFHLKCKGKKRGYSDRVEIAGDSEAPVVIRKEESLRALSVEELNVLMGLMSKMEERNRIAVVESEN